MRRVCGEGGAAYPGRSPWVSWDARPASVMLFVGWEATVVAERSSLTVEKSAEAVLPAGIVDGGWEGPNAKPSVRTFVLVIVALTAANPSGGLSGSDRG
jgi:hypothetical protein